MNETVAGLPHEAIATRLRSAGLALDFGLVRARVRSDVPALPDLLKRLYGAFPALPSEGFFDLTVGLYRQRGLRRVVRPQVVFQVDGSVPFQPFPADTHLPLLEWGMNWCIAQRCHRYLLLHAGVVEREGRAVVLPAHPGSGKSTLTAGLACRGYRLLSDEFGVVDLESGRLLPLLRPVALKNESIGVIRRFASQAVLGPEFPKTRKGTVAHLAPSPESVERRHVPAQPFLIVFPKYAPGSPVAVERVPAPRAFVKLSGNAFNYETLGPAAFDAVARLTRACEAYRLQYGDLEQAVRAVDRLTDRAPRAGEQEGTFEKRADVTGHG
ncbi:HprK-related kinase A [Pelomicrobium sp. G1]|uniref:HprK-related kinase A n=1 Tax=unclassified Pelomicrobium TaxID=2815318 RepID=UPI003F765BE0